MTPPLAIQNHVHEDEATSGAAPSSCGKRSPSKRLAKPLQPNPRPSLALVFEGADYVRTARDAACIAFPRISHNERCARVSGYLGVSHNAADYLLHPQSVCQSVKAEHLHKLIAMAGNPFHVPGVKAIHDAIFGSHILNALDLGPGEYRYLNDGVEISITVTEVTEWPA